MASVCLQAKGYLLWSLCLLKWDETSERLSLKLVQHASLGQQRSTWTVMVVRMRFAWGWANGFSQSCEVACPVMPLKGTTAEDLHAALFQHPHMQPIMAFKNKLFELSKHAFDIYEADGASGNDRLYHHLLPQAPQNTLCEFSLCRNHQNHLINASVIQKVGDGLQYVNDLFCFTSFLRMGAHFLRLICALRLVFVPSNVSIELGPAPRDARLFAAEFCDYLIKAREWLALRRQKARKYASHVIDRDREEGSQSCHGASPPPAHRCSPAFTKALHEFFAVFNGRSGPKLIHHCSGSDCCINGEVTTCERMTNSVCAVLLSRVPELPAMSKWTNVACCVDSFVGLILANNVLEQLFTETFRKMRTPTRSASTTEGGGDLADDGSFDWHKVAGRRLSRARGAATSRVWRVSLVTLAIVAEPLRTMTRFFMHCSSTTHRYCSRSHLVDLANPASSVIVIALQYLSTLLFSKHGRVELLLRAVGHNSLEEFIRLDRPLAKRFRLSILHASGEIYRRHASFFRDFP